MNRVHKRIFGGLLLPLICLMLAGCGRQEADGGAPKQPYPLDRCLVCDKMLGAASKDEAQAFVYEGQEIKVCGEACRSEFHRNRDMYLSKLPPPLPEPPQP